MVITGYRAEHFRNLKWIELFPDPGVNVIFGENGQGSQFPHAQAHGTDRKRTKGSESFPFFYGTRHG